MDTKLSAMNRREKVTGFCYIFFLFLLFSTICCMVLFAFNTRWGFTNRKETIQAKMEVSRKFRQEQVKASPLVRELHEKIEAYTPDIHAHYERENINYLLGEIRNIYARNAWDARYKVFLHVADFYEMWYEDKRTRWALEENVQKVSSHLQECEMGVTNKRNNLSGRR